MRDDDASRVGFVQMHTNERKDSAVDVLLATALRNLGRDDQGLMKNIDSTYRSRLFAKTCQALGIKHTFTRQYRPQINARPSASFRHA